MTEMPVERSWDVVPVGTGRVRPARVLQRHHRVLPCRPVQDERHLLRQRQGDFTKKLEPSLMKQCKLACWGGCYLPQAYCYDGGCKSHTEQCRLLWGPTGKRSHDICFDQNTFGNKTGNCGFYKANGTFSKCRQELVPFHSINVARCRRNPSALSMFLLLSCVQGRGLRAAALLVPERTARVRLRIGGVGVPFVSER